MKFKEVKFPLLSALFLWINLIDKELAEWETVANFVSAFLYFRVLVSALERGFFSFCVSCSFSIWINQVWLVTTISNYSNIHLFFSILVFFGYGVLNFGLSVILFFINKIFSRFGILSLPLAWTCWESLNLQLFDWKAGYLFFSTEFIPAISSLCGSSLLSFLLLAFVCLSKRSRSGIIFSTLILILELSLRLFSSVYQTKELNALLVQPNHSLENKHNVLKISELINDVKDLIKPKLHDADLVILPESVVYYFFPQDKLDLKKDPVFNHLALGKNLVFGALTKQNSNYYNSVILVDEKNEPVGIYNKMILMPFGEFMPFRKVLSFVLPFHPIEDFSTGLAMNVFELAGVRISALICYEDLYPSLSVEAVLKGAELLLVVSNDLWFGRKFVPALHDRFAGFRAVEAGITLVRVSNAGYTSVFSPRGTRTILLEPNKAEARLEKIKLEKINVPAKFLMKPFELGIKILLVVLLVYFFFNELLKLR
ncbi:MAG: apolipoprotein N-acyltransferase [Deltaproteobacteria bacterium]|nr:apolipoprotein N-acyltransferase [Deltaproteobacteria bacterium]